MSRVSENQINRTLLADIIQNRLTVNKLTQEISSGYKVSLPGDTKQAGTIAKFRDSLAKIELFQERVTFAEGYLIPQEGVLEQANELLVRAQEIATQGANETVSETERSLLAEEVHEIREHMVTLANTTYQGRYIFGGAADDVPPFSRTTDYTNPANGGLEVYRYAYNTADGNQLQRQVQVTDDLTVTVNTPADQLFQNSIEGLERLGRALEGYRTEPAAGTPDGTGTAYTFPTDFAEQTQDIQNALDILDQARETEIMPERTNIAGRLRRLETAASILELNKSTSQQVLADLQEVDIAESASNLTQAQTALEAAITVSGQILRTSILDFI